MLNQSIKKKLSYLGFSFIKKNTKILIVLLIILFILLFGYFLYKNVEKNNNILISEQYTEALILIKQKKNEESKALLEKIINKNHKFYSPLALYLMIDKNFENEQFKIILFFDNILKNNSIEKENINLIRIKKALYLINFDNEQLITETLNPVINSSSVWRKTAIDLIVTYYLEKKQKIKAEEYIQLLGSNSK